MSKKFEAADLKGRLLEGQFINKIFMIAKFFTISSTWFQKTTQNHLKFNFPQAILCVYRMIPYA